MKRLLKPLCLILALTMTLVMGLAGCGNTQSPQPNSSAPVEASNNGGGESAGTKGTAPWSGMKVGIFVKTLHNPYFREMAYGAIKTAEEQGIEYMLTSGRTNGDVAEQIQICEDMLQSGIDVLIMTPQNSTGLATLVETADQMGVPVIVINTTVDDAEVTCSIVQDDAQFGVDLAHETANAIGGKGRIIMLEGVAGASASELPARAVEKTIKEEYPDIELIMANANFSQDMAQQTMADLLQAYDDVDGVITIAMLMGLGAKVSLEEAGYTVSKDASKGVIMSTITVDRDTLLLIEDGQIYGAHYGWPQVQGLLALEMAKRAYQGNSVPNYIASPVTFFTAENVSQIHDDVLTVYNYEFR